MDPLGIVAFTFALPALGIGIMNQFRLNNLENKLKDFDVIPRKFSSEGPPKGPDSQG